MPHNLKQNWSKFEQGDVGGVVVPRANLNAILWVVAKVGGHVVHYYRLLQIAPNPAQVFHVDMILLHCVLSVQPERDQVLNIQLVQHPVGIVLHRRSKDDDFVGLTHLSQELMGARPDQKVPSDELRLITIVIFSPPLHLDEMNQSLIQVQHKGELHRCSLLG